jgi:uncharacterized protein (TIGR02171 family)
MGGNKGMIRHGITGLTITLLLLASCIPNAPESKDNDAFPPSGMKKISAAGCTFQQGWNDARAPSDEKPGMSTSFTCDFWIDSIEVTQALFHVLMKRNPVLDTSPHGIGDRYPVYNVTWFDAILFCNARSKSEQRDTVYSYSGKDTLSSGAVYDIIGLRCDYSRKGYRLPTEAEWEFAARGGRADLFFTILDDTTRADTCAWYSINSGDESHPVATKAKNDFGLYDMAGNVFEWVNDWKGFYTGTPITDPIGARWPNDAYERVVKGGSFKTGYLYLRPSNRSTTYPTAVASRAEYVGFRCALGAIPEGQYLEIDTSGITTDPVDLVESPVRPLMTTSRVRIVFVNVRQSVRRLCCLDFSEAHPMVREFPDAGPIYCPAISPDGRYVAYATRNEGASGTSTIFVRPLDSFKIPARAIPGDSCFVPRWWVDKNANDTFIVYVNSAEDNTSSTWASTLTYRQKMSRGMAVGDREVVITGGGFHDGISSEGRYVVTGYRNLLMRDIQNGTTRQLFVSPLNGKDADGSDQVCNVSICPDPRYESRCLLLDFGYPRASSIVGSSYGIHEYVFMTDFDQVVHAWYKKPPGTQAWADVEWSNKYPFAIAGATDATESVPDIYIINLTENVPYRVLHGTDLRQPALWVADMGENPDALSLDSLGHYNDPSLTEYQTAFSYKMHLFWQKRTSIEIAFLGSSQVFNGIDCNLITGYSALNLSYPACGVSGSVMMARDYVFNHCPKVRLIGLSLTPYWMAEPGGDAMDLGVLGVSSCKGYQYDKSHKFWTKGLPANFDALMDQAPYFVCCEWDSFGLAPGPCLGWGGDIPECGGRIDWTTENSTYRNNFTMIQELVRDCAARKIHVLMVVFPESPGYKNTDFFTRGGPSWETGRAVIAELKGLETENPYFHLYDAYNFGDHDYTDADAFNWNHLCPAGAVKLTKRLDTVIHGILGNEYYETIFR